MHYVQLVYVFDTSEYLLKELASLFLFQTSVCDYVIEKFTPRSVLHDEVQLFRGLDDLIKLDDIRMTNELQDVDLASDSFHIWNVRDTVFLKDFYRDLFSCEMMGAKFDLPKSPLSNGFF